MLPLLACAVLCPPGRYAAAFRSVTSSFPLVIEGEERLRTILPNGAVIYVERKPAAGRLVIQFFVSGRSNPDTVKTNGYRHLWEHLVAKGRIHGLDTELEPQGAFLTAETYRESTVFQIVLKATDLTLGLHAVHALTEMGELTVVEVTREATIIGQEVALESDFRGLSESAWQAAYGDLGLDPDGDPDQMAAASPTAIQHLHQELMKGGNLTLLISGDVDLDGATAAAKQVLGSIPGGPVSAPIERHYQGGGVGSCNYTGSALALPVTGWNSPATAARLAAALAIAASTKMAFVTYTPSLEGSLIVVGQTEDSDSFSKKISKLDPGGLFALGRALAHRWVDHEDSLDADGVLTGLLLSEGAGQKVQTMHDNLDRMSVSDFKSAFNSFTGKSAVEILGK